MINAAQDADRIGGVVHGAFGLVEIVVGKKEGVKCLIVVANTISREEDQSGVAVRTGQVCGRLPCIVLRSAEIIDCSVVG